MEKKTRTRVNFVKADEVDIACPACGSRRSRVKDSRAHEGQRYRLRVCVSCKINFGTKESVIDASYYSIFRTKQSTIK